MYPQYFISSLAQTLNVGGNDSSIGLSTIYTQDGQVLTTSDLAPFGRGIITVNPTVLTSAEFISFTGITPGTAPAGTLTGCTRGLSFLNSTQIPANQKFNVIGTPVIISFGTHNIQDLVTLINGIVANQGFLSSTIQTGSVRLSAPPATTLGNPTITIGSPAVVTLASHGLTAGDVVAFTTTGALPTGITPGVNYYVLTAGLGTNTFEFSTTAGGTAINTTGTQSGTHTLTKNTPVAVSSNDYRISPYEVDTGTANTFVITVPNFPAAYAASQTLVFKALNANTGVSTLNVNGLGTKTIHKNGTLSLVANDIVAGQIVEVIYDGTNFQMTTPTPQTYTNKFSNGTTTKNTADASTVQTIAHSLGIAPSRVNITAKISTTSGLNEVFEMFVTFDSSGTSGLSTAWTSGTAYISGLLTNVSLPNVSSNYAQTGVITVDATNIYITWTRSGVASGIIYNISWKAEY